MNRGLMGVLSLATVGLLATTTVVASADPLAGPTKVEIPSPAPGVADPFDPPTIAAPDPALVSLDVPDSHPWMLFDPTEASVRFATISTALAATNPTTAQETLRDSWLSIKGAADRCCAGRDSIDDAFNQSDFEQGRFGRSDLAELGIVWHFTGDDAYLVKAKQLLQYLIGLSPDYGAPKEPGVDEYYIQRAHRLNGLALAYDVLHEGFSEDERRQLRTIVEVLADQIYVHSNTAWWGTISSGSNIGAHGAAALGVAGLALYDEVPEARAWLLRGEQLVRSYLHDGFDIEGAGFEGILYGNYGLRIITFLEAALSRTGAGGLFNTGGINRQQEWFAYELLPGGGAVNPINDARYYEINPTYTTWATTHGDSVHTANGSPTDLSRWLFDNFVPKMTNGRSLGETIATVLWYEPLATDFSPEDVLPLAEDFAERGLVHVRSGWGSKDFMASFEARQNDWGEGVHQDSNVNSLTLYDGPSRLIVDSRYANWLSQVTAGKDEAARSSNSEAHNYIVSDGRSQDFHGKGDLVSFVSTAAVGEPGAIDLAVGDARLAWLTDQPKQAERVFITLRPTTPGRPTTVLLADRFEQGLGLHDYTSFFHTEWNNDLRLSAGGADIVPISDVRTGAPAPSSDPALRLDVIANAGAPTLTVDEFTPDDGQDWRSLNNGSNQRRAHDRLKIEQRSDRFESFTLLAPRKQSQVGTAAMQRIATTNGLGVQILTDGSTDVAYLAVNGDRRIIGPAVSARASTVVVRSNGTGRPAAVGDIWAYAASDVTSLVANGRNLIVSDEPITISASATRIDVETTNATYMYLGGPRWAEVSVNGVVVPTLYDVNKSAHFVKLPKPRHLGDR